MPERREGKAFEPPPWEQEQFEELARRRQESLGSSTDDDAGSTAPEAAGQATIQPEAQAQAVAVVEPDKREARPKVEIEEAQMVELLSALSAQEASSRKELWRIGLFGSVVTGAIGLMMCIIGLVAMRKAGAAGMFGMTASSILLFFGLGFIGLAIWTANRTLKQRGVL